MERITSWMTALAVRVRTLRDEEEGQALVEYALILFLVSIAAVAILTLVGTSVSSLLSKVNADL